MIRFTKSGLANTLQIAAVLILFGYPGCSPDKRSKETTSAAGNPAKGDSTDRLKTIDLRSSEEANRIILLK